MVNWSKIPLGIGEIFDLMKIPVIPVYANTSRWDNDSRISICDICCLLQGGQVVKNDLSDIKMLYRYSRKAGTVCTRRFTESDINRHKYR